MVRGNIPPESPKSDDDKYGLIGLPGRPVGAKVATWDIRDVLPVDTHLAGSPDELTCRS